MALRVYNTLTRQKEPFQTVRRGHVGMYVCGPTVYKPSHIGHMVGPVIFDTVKRFLNYLGYNVTWVVNITDVDDKLIVRLKELGTTVKELAEKMTADYVACLRKLNVIGIDHMPKATEHIGEMIQMMQGLIDKGYAYAAGGDVYFDVTRDADYGKLCNRDPAQMEAGVRIEVSEKKRNPGDFALWKGSKPGEPAWDSPWGPGRPGWHIECSAMSMKYLGQTLDIHGGGLDLQFPHHENELAQSESYSDKPFANYWMHNGLMQMGKAKMAGSVGNVINVGDLLKVHHPETVRFLLLATHYRSPIDYGEERLQETHQRLDGFYRFFERYQRITSESFYSIVPVTTETEDKRQHDQLSEQFKSDTVVQNANAAYLMFVDFMNDDFNTGGAIGWLSNLLTELNRYADERNLEDPERRIQRDVDALKYGVFVLRSLAWILGLFAEAPAKKGGDDQLTAGLMRLLIDLRNEARKSKNYALGDQIRNRLKELGVTLEDRAGETGWRVANVRARRHGGSMSGINGNAPSFRILGIDPGLQVTGYAVLEVRPGRPHVCEAGIVKTSEGRKTTDLAPRLLSLYDGIVEIVEQYKPQAMAIEQLYAHYAHPRTAILMGHARGVIFLAAARQLMPVISYAATRIKKTITGHGRASKEQMQQAIMSELRLPKLPEPHDVSDALAAALCHYYLQKTPARGTT